MPRFLCFALATLLVVGLAHSNGQTSGKSDSTLPPFTGIVKAVAATSLLVQRFDRAMLFVVDQTTRVFANGCVTKQPDGTDVVWRQRLFIDVVKVGDQVAVEYRLGATTPSLPLVVRPGRRTARVTRVAREGKRPKA
jgi:hypothetical protein